MKVVLIGNHSPVQKFLANQIAQQFDLCGLVLLQKKNQNSTDGFFDQMIFKKIIAGKKQVEQFYNNHYVSFPNVPTLYSEKLNTMDVARFLFQCSAELLVTVATPTLKNPLLELYFSKGNINLSYSLKYKLLDEFYSTNQCLAENQFEQIGNTITTTTDSAAEKIIEQKQTTIIVADDFVSIHQKVFNEGQRMLLDVLYSIQQNKTLTVSLQLFEKLNGLPMNYNMKKKLMRNLRSISFGKPITD